MSRGRLVSLAWIAGMLALLTVTFSAAYFLTSSVYAAVRLNPPGWLAQVVNSMLGLVFTGVLIGNAARYARTKGWAPEMNVFSPIIEALDKIAQGDFSVRVENKFADNPAVSQLSNTVNKMALELDQMESLRQEFISNVSHEIQSPLTSIRGFAQALRGDQLSADEREHYIAVIVSESTRLSRITDNLLRLAALESDRPKFEPIPYRLDKQVRSLILACEPQWTAKRIEMDVSLQDALITADQDLMSQVWSNLIHNSIKFTPEGGRIGVELCRRADRREFKITDTGPGIAPEDQAHVFERFYKADKSRTRSNGGSGLGLAIAKKVVEMHHGSIALESDVGAGTTFTVTLPAG
ncbi:MAG: HAMP domain-containing histidine kinase [Chloroflexi bacterium]|nr:HAMP domain-containing histidine kinase [Chloroflexota bacterium]